MAEAERSPKRRKIHVESGPPAATDAATDGAVIETKVAHPDSDRSNSIDITAEDNVPQHQTHGAESDVQDAAADIAENDPLQAIDAKPNDTTDAPLSKSQQKKLRRKQQYEESRAERKAWKKEKLKEKKARKRAAQSQGTDEASVATNEKPGQSFAKRKEKVDSKHHRPVQLPITVIFDCSFDDLMMEKELVSLASQLTRSYSENYKAKFRNHMAISSFGGKLKERFDTVLSKHHENWKGVRFFDEDFVSVAEQSKDWMRGEQGGQLAGAFNKTALPEVQRPTDRAAEESTQACSEDGEIIYLTSDSPNTMTELKPYSTYIIGGLVDRNRHKGICYKRACDRGMQTARLPIGLYMQMTSRFVLATNHVAEIMLRWLELRDWGKAFMDVMPKRKGGVLKEKVKGPEAEDGNGTPKAAGAERDDAKDREERRDVGGEEHRDGTPQEDGEEEKVAMQEVEGIGVKAAVDRDAEDYECAWL